MASNKTIKHLWALDAPLLKADKGTMILGAGGELVALPAPSFLIEHAEHGLLIFDTGLAGAGDPGSAYGPLAEMFAIDFPAEHALDRQLESLGFSTADVRRVVISHLHFDHTGGLEHFAGAQGFIGSGELRYAQTPDNHVKGFYRQEDLDAIDRINWTEVPTGYDHDVFGDGSVVLLSMPGHTPGSLGLQLRLPDSSTLILSGDVAHIQDNISCCIGMPFDADTVAAIESLKKLKLLCSQPKTVVWVNHDIDDWNRLRVNGRQIV